MSNCSILLTGDMMVQLSFPLVFVKILVKGNVRWVSPEVRFYENTNEACTSEDQPSADISENIPYCQHHKVYNGRVVSNLHCKQPARFSNNAKTEKLFIKKLKSLLLTGTEIVFNKLLARIMCTKNEDYYWRRFSFAEVKWIRPIYRFVY